MRPKYIKWSRGDLKKLFEMYPTSSNTDLQREFAGRSMTSIISMANNMGARRRRNWKAIAAAHEPVILGVRAKAGEVVE